MQKHACLGLVLGVTQARGPKRMEEKMGFGLKRVERQAGEGGKGGALAVRGWLPLSRSLSSAPARPGRVAESPPPRRRCPP